MASTENTPEKVKERSFQDYFHPIVLMIPFIAGVSFLLYIISQSGKRGLSWWHIPLFLFATECWSFGWHLRQHHGSERNEESALWRLVGLVTVLVAALIIIFTQIVEQNS